VVRVSCEISDL